MSEDQIRLDLYPTDGEPGAGGEGQAIVTAAAEVFARLADLDDEVRIEVINALRADLHRYSPMAAHPVDCIQWIPAGSVDGNAYNPNVVAPPELELLRRSIAADGYTQPIVAWPVGDHQHEVVDGFHRHLIGKTDAEISASVRGRLPVAVINPDRTGKPDRMAATIRHNRARGEHTVTRMSDLVIELARLGKSDAWIGTELGMEADEVTKLRQITGISIADTYAREEYSEAWDIDPYANPDPQPRQEATES